MKNKLIALAVFLVVLVAVLLLWTDIRQWIDGSRQDETQQKISFAVTTAGTICLTDTSTHESRAVTTNTAAKVGALSGEGRIARDEIRKSVDLAVSEAGLLGERKRVSDCMSRQMIRLLEVQNLVKSDPVPSAPVAEVPKADQACVARKIEELIGPKAIPAQRGGVHCEGGGVRGRGEHLTDTVRLAAAPGFAIVGSVDVGVVSNIDGRLGTPQYIQDAAGHVVAATVAVSCTSPNRITGPGASMNIKVGGMEKRIAPLTGEEKADIADQCPLGSASVTPAGSTQAAAVTGNGNIVGAVGPGGAITISSTGGTK